MQAPAMQGKLNNVAGRNSVPHSGSVRNMKPGKLSLKWEMIKRYLMYVQCLYCETFLN